MEIEDHIRLSLAKHARLVVLRSEFATLGSSSQIGRVLARLVADGTLVRVSKGAFATTRVNKFTGQPTVAGTLEAVAAELLHKLQIEVFPSVLVAEYNSGRSTQLPAGTTLSTGRRRITRKITVGNRTVTYERRSGRIRETLT